MASQDIYQALRAAQLEFPRIAKTRTAKVESRGGAGFQYSYADLSDVIAAITPVLAKHDLCVTQIFGEMLTQDGRQVAVLSTQLHWSPEREDQPVGRITSEIPVPLTGNAQDLGSWITYLRRYSLLAIVGLAPEDDDDGAAAQPALPPTRPAQRSQGQAGGRVAPSSRVSGQPAKPPLDVPRGTPPEEPSATLPASWWQEPVGWGNTKYHGKLVREMTWMEMVDGAHVDGGRMGWMKSQGIYLRKTIEEGLYAGWARSKQPRLEAAIAFVNDKGLRSKPPEPPKEAA